MTSLLHFSNQRERTFWVQAELRLRGSSFASIARDHGWSRTVVRNAMYQALDAQERAIAEQLGISQQTLFPERFDSEGNRLHHVREIIRPHRRHNVKKRDAA